MSDDDYLLNDCKFYKIWVVLQKCAEDSDCKYFVYNHDEEEHFWSGRFRFPALKMDNCFLLKKCNWEKLQDRFLEISYRKRGTYTFNYLHFLVIYIIQECIPGGCETPAAVATTRCQYQGDLSPWGLYPGGSLSRGVSVQGISVQGVSVQGISVQGVSVQEGLCHGDPLRTEIPSYGEERAVRFLLECFLVIALLFIQLNGSDWRNNGQETKH